MADHNCRFDTARRALISSRPFAILLIARLVLLHTLHRRLIPIPSPPVHKRLRNDGAQPFIRVIPLRFGVTHDFARLRDEVVCDAR